MSAGEARSVVRLTARDLAAASGLYARAFRDYPLFAYFVPDPDRRAVHLARLFRFLVACGLRYGEVHADAGNPAGIATWLPGARAELSYPQMILAGGLALYPGIGLAAVRRMEYFNAFSAPLRRRLAPPNHWYLNLLAVDPDAQSRGTGGLLLRHMLDRLDAEGRPVYLETENPENLPFYRHFGFQVKETLALPRSPITIWGMLRTPGTASA